MTISFILNGSPFQYDGDPEKPLLWVLREDAGLTGTKYRCGIAACGACTVHIDGVATRCCIVAGGRRRRQHDHNHRRFGTDRKRPTPRSRPGSTAVCRNAVTASRE